MSRSFILTHGAGNAANRLQKMKSSQDRRVEGHKRSTSKKDNTMQGTARLSQDEGRGQVPLPRTPGLESTTPFAAARRSMAPVPVAHSSEDGDVTPPQIDDK